MTAVGFGSLGILEVLVVLVAGALQLAFYFFLVYFAVRVAQRADRGRGPLVQFKEWWNRAFDRAGPHHDEPP